MVKMRFEYPETVPQADRLPEHLVRSGRKFFKALFTPESLPSIATANYKEWKYAPAGSEPSEFKFEGLTGVRGLMRYREQFAGPTLLGYDLVGVPLSRSFDIPHKKGQLVGGFVFRSYFKLPENDPVFPVPPDMPAVSLLMEEHLVFDHDGGMVAGRMYLPYDEQGPIGPNTERPNLTQFDVVGRQVEHFATNRERLALPTARQVFQIAYPGIAFTSPVPEPFPA